MISILSACVCISPVPFRLPTLLDLSEWELLLASPAEPDFALFPFSRIHTKSTKTKQWRARACLLQLYSRYVLKAGSRQTQAVSADDKATPPQTDLIMIFIGLPSLATCHSSNAIVKAWATVKATAWAWRTGARECFVIECGSSKVNSGVQPSERIRI